MTSQPETMIAEFDKLLRESGEGFRENRCGEEVEAFQLASRISIEVNGSVGLKVHGVDNVWTRQAHDFGASS
jgi:hypothetical protein